MTVIDKQVQSIHSGLVTATAAGFVPPSDWPELEEARLAHERALAEHAGVEARRREQRAEERQLQDHLARVQEAKRAARQEASRDVKNATADALRVVAEYGEKWLAEMAEEREAALAEAAEHRAAMEAAEARAHKDDALVTWIRQALSDSVPQPFGAVADRVAS